jgi:4-aminobutyrate--pyruvate transaminase
VVTALGYGNDSGRPRPPTRALPFAHLFWQSHDPAIELAERLKQLVPVPTSRCSFVVGSGERHPDQAGLVHE